MIYMHFKGGLYRLLFEAKDSEDLSPVIVYQSIKDNVIWTRPKKEFFETVTQDDVKTPRFKLIGLENENSSD